ncbi:MAG: carboxypeptidase regulatory-like domain-containing protein [Candidatus Acetothermia bacterium]|jgi:hypothetical protein|nr:carboxypeptidase regulatory-like domain-containing protein [Candidatus Acetothermia bacterium]MDH7505647.1 carboxypeptidase regulatory-like domain-containing protein [Candidatus Acetothermia bacterium]
MRWKVRGILGIGLLLSLLLFLWGCNLGAISGRVIDQATGKPVAGAQVTVGDKSARTGAMGSYQITGIPVGTRTLRVTAPGYEEYTRELKIKQGAQVVDVSLSPITMAGPTPPEGSAPSTGEVVGPEGGRIIVPEEVKLVVPPRALAEDTRITVRRMADPPPPPPGTSFASLAYDIALDPQEQLLDSPAELTIPLLPEALQQRDEKTLLTVAYWSGTEWLPLGGEVNEQAGAITVETRHFSSFSVLRRVLSITPLTTEHFRIIPFLAAPSSYTLEQLGQQLEKAWDLIISELGYELPTQTKSGAKIQVWIVPTVGGGRTGGWLEKQIRERLLAYVNYSIYLGPDFEDDTSVLEPSDLLAVIPTHELFHNRSDQQLLAPPADGGIDAVTLVDGGYSYLDRGEGLRREGALGTSALL